MRQFINSTYVNFNTPLIEDFENYHSEESQLKRMYELRLRSFCEFKRCSELGQHLYFFTLTFNQKTIKHFKYKSDEKDEHANKTYDLLVLDWDFVNKFFRNIRNYLLEKYGVTKTTYICASELGGEFGRPHLHMLISFPKFSDNLQDDINTAYSIVSRYWDRGFIFPRVAGEVKENKVVGTTDRKGIYHNPILVEPDCVLNCVQYITKYVLKSYNTDNDIYDESVQYFTKIRNLQKLKELKHGLPKVKVSLRFGQAIEEIMYNNSNNILECIKNGLDLPEYSKEIVEIPSYTKRRIFTDNVLDRIEENEDKKIYRYVRQKTDLYFDYKKFIRESQLYKTIENVKTYANLLSRVRDYTIFDDFVISQDDIKFIQRFREYREVSIYMNVYRNRISPLHYYDFIHNPNAYIHTDILEKGKFKWMYRKNGYGKELRIIGKEPDDKYSVLNRTNFKIVESTYLPCNVRFYKDVNFFARGDENKYTLLNKAFEYDDFMFSVRDNWAALPELPCVHWAIFYNSFPCFAEYERFITLLNDFKKFVSKRRCTEVVELIKEQKNVLNELYAYFE